METLGAAVRAAVQRHAGSTSQRRSVASAPTMLEIGFGMGDATAQIAAARPQRHFLGIEVHTPGVGALLQRIEERGLDEPAHRRSTTRSRCCAT